MFSFLVKMLLELQGFLETHPSVGPCHALNPVIPVEVIPVF